MVAVAAAMEEEVVVTEEAGAAAANNSSPHVPLRLLHRRRVAVTWESAPASATRLAPMSPWKIA